MIRLSDLLETLTDPAMRHAAFVHMPVTLAFMGLVLIVISAVLRGRSARCTAFTVLTFGLVALTSWIVVESGVDAKAELGAHPDDVMRLVADHERMARRLWMFALGAACVAAVGFVPIAKARIAAVALSLIAGIAVMTSIAMTAHQGGSLVYRHAAGVAPIEPPEPPAFMTSLDSRATFFQNHVAPILSAHCLGCHGSHKPAAGIDLGSIASLLNSGLDPVVVPGHPDGSSLFQTVMWDGDIKMPPPSRDGSGQLDSESIEVLRRWISDGAVWAVVDDGPDDAAAP